VSVTDTRQPAVLRLSGLTSTLCRLPPLTGPWQTGAVNERMTAQLRIIKAVVNALDAAGIPAWLLFPPGSFGDEPGTLDGMPVLAMSVAGMLAMKEQYPRLRNGRPWRQKDIDDMVVLRRLAAEADARPSANYRSRSHKGQAEGFCAGPR
jgi:hypothetical protein